jgi:polygalacturonase
MADVRSCGAAGDGASLDTQAVQRALDTAAEAGGGTALLSPGTYRCGTLHLRSRVTLRLEAGAVLLASGDDRDFDPFETLPYQPWADQETHSFTFALLAGLDVEGVAIVGEGTIADHRHQRIGPKPVALKRCRDVVVRGITITGAPNYAISLLGCENVTVDGVTIRDGYADGIDPDCCRFVRIANCDIDCWDDAICIKTSLSLGEPRPTEHVTVSNCTLRSSCNNFKIGTETSGAVRNIAVSNCAMLGRPADPPSDENSGIAIESADGAVVEGVVVANVAMQEVATPIFIRLGNRGRGLDPPVPGSISAIRVANVVATGAQFTSSISGLSGHPVRSVIVDGLTVETVYPDGSPGAAGFEVPEQADHYPRATMFGPLPARALYARHVEDLTVRDLEVRGGDGDARPALVCDDVAGLRLPGLRAAEPAYAGRAVTVQPSVENRDTGPGTASGTTPK